MRVGGYHCKIIVGYRGHPSRGARKRAFGVFFERNANGRLFGISVCGRTVAWIFFVERIIATGR